MKIACVGNRRVSSANTSLAEELAEKLANRDWIIRLGGSSGFEELILKKISKRCYTQIFLPWQSYNEILHPLADEVTYFPSQEAMDLASEYLPNWMHSSSSTRSHYSRYCHVVLGLGLDSPVDAVISLSREKAHAYLALQIAYAENIPYIDLFSKKKDRKKQIEKAPEEIQKLEDILLKF